MELRGGGLSPMNDASIDTMNAMAFQQNALEASEAGSYPESRGWFVWYWDRGMNLVYWQRRPSGHIVGAALERARWIADLISCLPESSDIVKDSATVDTAFRVVTSSVEPVYRWGADFALDGPPYCEIRWPRRWPRGDCSASSRRRSFREDGVRLYLGWAQASQHSR